MNYERNDSNLQEQDKMTATNIDKELESLCARLENVENEFGEAKEVHKSARDGILTEAKIKGYSPVGITRHVKKRMETDKQRNKRLEAEESEEEVAAKLGQLSDTGLGRAAIAQKARLRSVV